MKTPAQSIWWVYVDVSHRVTEWIKSLYVRCALCDITVNWHTSKEHLESVGTILCFWKWYIFVCNSFSTPMMYKSIIIRNICHFPPAWSHSVQQVKVQHLRRVLHVIQRNIQFMFAFDEILMSRWNWFLILSKGEYSLQTTFYDKVFEIEGRLGAYVEHYQDESICVTLMEYLTWPSRTIYIILLIQVTNGIGLP